VSAPSTHVLLDLDGTLSDSAPGITRSLQHAFVACGYEPPTAEQVRTVIGPPFEIGLPTLGIHLGDLDRVVAAYRHRYEDVGLFENTVYPGIAEMLDELRTAGHTLSLATAKPEDTARRIIEHFGFSSYFEVQAGATNDVGVGRRTKAQVIDYALIQLRLTPALLGNVVMVGDRDHDVEGAHLNGIECVGVTWGFGSSDELESAGAAVIVDTPGEVAAAVAATYRSVRP
jgi:phosphoglycolate phosphatase